MPSVEALERKSAQRPEGGLQEAYGRLARGHRPLPCRKTRRGVLSRREKFFPQLYRLLIILGAT